MASNLVIDGFELNKDIYPGWYQPESPNNRQKLILIDGPPQAIKQKAKQLVSHSEASLPPVNTEEELLHYGQSKFILLRLLSLRHGRD